MDTTDLRPAVEDLADNINDLEEALAPLLNAALSASTSKLPLLDKAKLYVLTTYAIESLLFSYLKLNGVDAKNHAVFQELTRVKHYFDKLKTAETGPAKPTTRLDKSAAGRFIKAGLAGNDEYDRQRKELQDRERAGAKRKFEDMGERVGSHLRFENTAKKLRGDDEELLAKEAESYDSEDDQGNSTAGAENEGSSDSKRKTRQSAAADMNTPEGSKKGKKKRSKLEATNTTESPQNVETILPKRQKSSKPPRGANEAFKALLEGPIPKEEEKKKKKRKSRG